MGVHARGFCAVTLREKFERSMATAGLPTGMELVGGRYRYTDLRTRQKWCEYSLELQAQRKGTA